MPSPRPAVMAAPTSSPPAPAYSRWSYLATARPSTPWRGNRTRRAWPRRAVDGTVKIWGVIEGGGRELMTLTGDDVRSGVDDIEFSPDGTKLIGSGRSGVTSVWDVGLSAGSEVVTLPAAGFFLSTAEFSPDGQHLFTTSSGGRVGMWDTDTWEQVRILGEPAARHLNPRACRRCRSDLQTTSCESRRARMVNSSPSCPTRRPRAPRPVEYECWTPSPEQQSSISTSDRSPAMSTGAPTARCSPSPEKTAMEHSFGWWTDPVRRSRNCPSATSSSRWPGLPSTATR